MGGGGERYNIMPINDLRIKGVRCHIRKHRWKGACSAHVNANDHFPNSSFLILCKVPGDS